MIPLFGGCDSSYQLQQARAFLAAVNRVVLVEAGLAAMHGPHQRCQFLGIVPFRECDQQVMLALQIPAAFCQQVLILLLAGLRQRSGGTSSPARAARCNSAAASVITLIGNALPVPGMIDASMIFHISAISP